MAWYDDLTKCDYFGLVDESRLFAVGWHERGRSFPTGVVEDLHLGRLCELVANAWQPVWALGYHDCDLCSGPEGPTVLEIGGQTIVVGASNVFLPAPGLGVLVAPSLVLHYIRTHQYRPPDVFLDAIDGCPPMGSAQYLDAIREAGGDGVVRMKRSASPGRPGGFAEGPG